MIPEIVAIAIGLGGFALLVTVALSPLETLTWWAGWTDRELTDDEAQSLDADPPAATPTTPDGARFVIYLSGVASISGDVLIRREKTFIAALRQAAPEAIVIDTVFPYSPAGLPLLATPRIFDRLWRRIQNLDTQGRRTILRRLINIRNIYQVMVSADHRYGPIFSQGAARVMENALLDAGLRIGAGASVTIIGYSGGAQVALGAAPFLKARIGAPITVISVGGVVASDPGLLAVDGFHHLRGEKDRVEKVGAIMFAQRWAMFVNSHWNSAKREGRIAFHVLDGVDHAGPRGYFGLPKRNGVPNYERTLHVVRDILLTQQEGAKASRRPGGAPPASAAGTGAKFASQ